MTVTMLLVGTRKGCFVLESDADRRTWKMRGPYCEGWPVYHAVHDADSGSIYAAAASEWHGAGVWRSDDLGETWELSSEGLGYGEDSELKLSKVSGLTAAHGRLLAGGEGCGVFESRDGGQDLVAAQHARRPARPRRLEHPRQPAARAPRPAGPAAAPGRARPLLGRRPGLRHLRDDRQRRLVDAAQPRPARRLAAREPRGRLLRAQARDVADRHTTACTSRTTSACTAATTPGTPGSRSPTGSRPSSASPPPRIRTTATAST